MTKFFRRGVDISQSLNIICIVTLIWPEANFKYCKTCGSIWETRLGNRRALAPQFFLSIILQTIIDDAGRLLVKNYLIDMVYISGWKIRFFFSRIIVFTFVRVSARCCEMCTECVANRVITRNKIMQIVFIIIQYT